MFHIQVGTRLIEHVDLHILDTGHSNSEALQFSTRKLADLPFKNLLEVELFYGLGHHAFLVLGGQNLVDEGFRDLAFGDAVNVLNFGQSLHIVFEQPFEVILELAAAEVSQDLFPLWRILVSAEVGLQGATEDSQRRGFADSVCSDQAENFSWPWHRESMKLETVGAVSMSDLFREAFGQVDNLDGFEGATLDAQPTAEAHGFRYVADLGRSVYFNANFARFVNRACLLALLGALFRLALVGVDNRDSQLIVSVHNLFLF